MAVRYYGSMAFWSRTDRLREGTYLVELAGELDLYTAAQCRRTLFDVIEAGAREIVVDLSGVSVVDSTTIGVFIIAENALQHRGGRLVLVCDNRASLARFASGGLTQLFELRLLSQLDSGWAPRRGSVKAVEVSGA